MFNERIRFHSNFAIDFVLKIVLSTTLICFLAPISFELSAELNATLQTLIILLCACAFGMKVGFFSALLYIIIGALGAPVFADKASGIEVVMGPHGGFFFGFVAAAAVAGFLSEKSAPRKFIHNLGIWILAHVLILAMGFGWLKSVTPDVQVWDNVQPLISGMFIKIAIGILVLHILGRFIDRKEQRQAKS
jgi:biotin transport system substrate-specific component